MMKALFVAHSTMPSPWEKVTYDGWQSYEAQHNRLVNMAKNAAKKKENAAEAMLELRKEENPKENRQKLLGLVIDQLELTSESEAGLGDVDGVKLTQQTGKNDETIESEELTSESEELEIPINKLRKKLEALNEKQKQLTCSSGDGDDFTTVTEIGTSKHIEGNEIGTSKHIEGNVLETPNDNLKEQLEALQEKQKQLTDKNNEKIGTCSSGDDYDDEAGGDSSRLAEDSFEEEQEHCSDASLAFLGASFFITVAMCPTTHDFIVLGLPNISILFPQCHTSSREIYGLLSSMEKQQDNQPQKSDSVELDKVLSQGSNILVPCHDPFGFMSHHSLPCHHLHSNMVQDFFDQSFCNGLTEHAEKNGNKGEGSNMTFHSFFEHLGRRFVAGTSLIDFLNDQLARQHQIDDNNRSAICLDLIKAFVEKDGQAGAGLSMKEQYTNRKWLHCHILLRILSKRDLSVSFLGAWNDFLCFLKEETTTSTEKGIARNHKITKHLRDLPESKLKLSTISCSVANLSKSTFAEMNPAQPTRITFLQQRVNEKHNLYFHA